MALDRMVTVWCIISTVCTCVTNVLQKPPDFTYDSVVPSISLLLKLDYIDHSFKCDDNTS